MPVPTSRYRAAGLLRHGSASISSTTCGARRCRYVTGAHNLKVGYQAGLSRSQKNFQNVGSQI